MIQAQVGAKGFVNWFLRDPKSGLILKHSRHKNLLVNGMRDSLHLRSITSQVSPTRPTYSTQRHELVVGDNAAAPSVNDAALANQIGSATTAGSFAQTVAEGGTKDITNNRLRWSSTIRKVYTFPSTQNIREIGFKDSAGVLTIRFLPLDGSNNPTTITGNAGQELIVEHTLTIDLAWPAAIQQTSFKIGTTGGNDGLGTFNVEWTFFSTTTAAIQNIFEGLLGTANQSTFISSAAFAALTRDPTPSGFTNASVNLAPQTYTNGSGQRVRQGVAATGQMNAQIFGVSFGQGTFGVLIRFLNPASYTKTSANQLTIPYRSEVTLNAAA